MPIVIDANELVKNKKRLPTEAFFVDTNIIIAYVDPFGRSLDNTAIGRRNEMVSDIIMKLKSAQYMCLSSIINALEYYKYIQVGFFNIETSSEKFDSEKFKTLRENNLDFIIRWEAQMAKFRRIFIKNFPLKTDLLLADNILDKYNGTSNDLGDYTMLKTVLSCEEKYHCIFSNDRDFLSFEDKFYLLTTNRRIIEEAKEKDILFLKL